MKSKKIFFIILIAVVIMSFYLSSFLFNKSKGDNNKKKMNQNIIIHGVHKIKAPQECYLVEMSIINNTEKFNLSEVSFEAFSSQFGKSYQAPFEEHYLSHDGSKILGNYTYERDHKGLLNGNFRIAFLIHFLDFITPLKTQHGDVLLPMPTQKPKRLKSLKYVSPY